MAADVPDILTFLQWNVELCAQSGRLVSRPLFQGIQEILREARNQGEVLFFFVRKPPGLRLRFAGNGFSKAHADALDDLLARERTFGRVAKSFVSIYEPELQRLGGPWLHDAVHRAFSDDTDAWLALSERRAQGLTQLAPELWTLFLTHELLLEGCGAEEEAWDVWCALLRNYAGEEPCVPTVRSRPLNVTALLARASASERARLQQARACQTRFLRALDATWRAGRLEAGKRSILFALVNFHWNRFAIEPATATLLCRAMVARLHPERVFLPLSAADES